MRRLTIAQHVKLVDWVRENATVCQLNTADVSAKLATEALCVSISRATILKTMDACGVKKKKTYGPRGQYKKRNSNPTRRLAGCVAELAELLEEHLDIKICEENRLAIKNIRGGKPVDDGAVDGGHTVE